MDGTNYTNLFGSPLLAHKWKDLAELNEALKTSFYWNLAAALGALQKTNVGGWHSVPGQLEFLWRRRRYDDGADASDWR